MATFPVSEIADQDSKLLPAFNVPWHPALMKFGAAYTAASRATNGLVSPCMLAAIVERETGGQNIFQIGVPHGDGCGVGLTQITYGVNWSSPDHPTYPNYGDLFDPMINLKVAAVEFLAPLMRQFSDNRRAAFAAYNAGAGPVSNAIGQGKDPDSVTTRGDYGQDIFFHWINFAAVSLKESADWSTWTH